MTYCAPAALPSLAYSSDCRAEPEDTPTVTGTRPSAASTTERTTSARSSRVSDAGLAHRAGRDEAVHAGLDQLLDVLLQRRDVDLIVGGERGGDGGDDAFEAGHG